MSVKTLKSEEKYRVILSKSEMVLILETFQMSAIITWSEEKRYLYKKLRHYVSKIDDDLSIPYRVPAERRETNRDILLDAISSSEFQAPITKPDYIALRAAAYEKWKIAPLSCTAHELELVETYKAENGLMSKEEEVEFMNNLMKGL